MFKLFLYKKKCRWKSNLYLFINSKLREISGLQSNQIASLDIVDKDLLLIVYTCLDCRVIK